MEKIRLSIATIDKLGKPEYQYQHFYRACEVDALLSDVAKLVEALEFYVDEDECKYGYGPSEGGEHPYCSDDDFCRWCRAKKAIAAVEARVKCGGEDKKNG